MGEGLKRVAKQCGGLTVTARGKTVQFDGDGNCLNPQFIYVVNDHCGRETTLERIEVLKETEKQIVTAERSNVFGCRSHLNKADVAIYRTPAEAIDGYIAGQRRELATLEQRAETARRKIEKAERLRENGGQP